MTSLTIQIPDELVEYVDKVNRTALTEVVTRFLHEQKQHEEVQASKKLSFKEWYQPLPVREGSKTFGNEEIDRLRDELGI